MPLFAAILIGVGSMLFGCISGAAIMAAPEPKQTPASATRPAESATPSSTPTRSAPAEPWEKVSASDRKSFLSVLGAADPRLIDGENQIKRGLRRAVTTCRAIEKDGLQGGKLAVYISQTFSGGHGAVSITEGRRLDKAIRRWICAPLGLATAKPSAKPSTSPTRSKTRSAAPKRTTAPKPRKTTRAPEPRTDPRFSSCAKANAAGYGPYRRGQPEYAWYQDRDGDGLVCER
ncbi:hypothetical protein GCM10010182_63130 [Actinomadura cremea]|nr:hypothetical protein GCM10010182_63130 [Actinomadura cremea]